MRPPEPGKYGRVVEQDGVVERIVEAADASPAELGVPLCNAGVMCAAAADMRRWLEAVTPNPGGGEYYLTDIVALAGAEGHRVVAVEADFAELRGINSRGELAAAEAVLQTRLRAAAMENGATCRPLRPSFSAMTPGWGRMSRWAPTSSSQPVSRSPTTSRSAPSATSRASTSRPVR